MDDSLDILLNSLRNSGVPIPPSVTAVKDLTPDSLFSVCSQSLRLIDKTGLFPPPWLEDSAAAHRFKLCSDLASTFKLLGFVGDISFRTFLYPTEEDLYNLVRFLVRRLADSESESDSFRLQKSLVVNQTGEVVSDIRCLRLQTEASESAHANSGRVLCGESYEDKLILGNLGSGENDGIEETEVRSRNSKGLKSWGVGQASIDNVADGKKIKAGHEITVGLGVGEHFYKHERKLASPEELLSEQSLLVDLIAKTSKSPNLLNEYELPKAEAEFDNQHTVDFYIHRLNHVIEARRDRFVKMDSCWWNALIMPLKEKRRNVEEASCAMKPEANKKLQRKKEVLREIESVSAETSRRDEQFFVLSAELENQAKVASRESFVFRIKEITKNSRKQDADVERILRETREIQLESNSIQERLIRTYAVLDETIFREARKDPVARQAYRLVTRIHECFEQTAENVLSIDRTRRKVADYEAKLATLACQSLNVDKLRADLKAIRKENDILESKIENNVPKHRDENQKGDSVNTVSSDGGTFLLLLSGIVF